jgi:hypothetical protein
VAGASVGSLFKAIIEGQFQRLRDGDRLFYRANAAGLYTNGVLNSDIAALVDLDHLTLTDVILANTSIGHLQKNVFIVPKTGDYNGDGFVDTADYVTWRRALGTDNVWVDGDGNGTVGPEDYDIWRSHFAAQSSGGGVVITQIPEPSTATLLVVTLFALRLSPGERRRVFGTSMKGALSWPPTFFSAHSPTKVSATSKTQPSGPTRFAQWPRRPA